MKNLITRLNEAAEQMGRGVHSPGHIAAIKDAVKALEQIDPGDLWAVHGDAEPGGGPGRIMELKPGTKMKIVRFRPMPECTEPIIAMMPLQSNVPEGNPGWELRTCPVCGRKCWYQTDNMRQLEIMAMGRELRLRCTECALREGTV